MTDTPDPTAETPARLDYCLYLVTLDDDYARFGRLPEPPVGDVPGVALQMTVRHWKALGSPTSVRAQIGYDASCIPPLSSPSPWKE